MAVDKFYVNYNEYLKVKKYFTKKVFKQMKSDLGYVLPIPEYNLCDFKNGDLTLWSTPIIFDMWLHKNCSLDFIQDQLKEKYDTDWFGFMCKDLIDFKEKGFLISIKQNDSYIAPFKNVENGIDVYTDLLVYGTTYAFKLLNNVFSLIKQQYVDLEECKGLTIEFELFSIHCVCEVSDTVKYYVIKNDIKMEIVFGYLSNELDRHFYQYKIKHSYDKKAYLKYQPEQIIMSHENSAFNVDMYKEFDINSMKRYFFFLPDYITKFMK